MLHAIVEFLPRGPVLLLVDAVHAPVVVVCADPFFSGAALRILVPDVDVFGNIACGTLRLHFVRSESFQSPQSPIVRVDLETVS